MNTWKLDETQTLNLFVDHPNGGTVHVWISARPDYCDRGHYQLNVSGIPDLDGQDMFPRYFMQLFVAMGEAERFLQWRLHKTKDNSESGSALALLMAADGVPASRF